MEEENNWFKKAEPHIVKGPKRGNLLVRQMIIQLGERSRLKKTRTIHKTRTIWEDL